MPVNSPIIELSHLHFAQNGQEVLCDITATIERGAYVGIVGPNGGGKTTLLKLILGLWKPNFGTVKILGTDPVSARRSGHIGYVPQRVVQSDFAFPATVEEIVRFISLYDRTTAQEAMETAGIAHLKHRLIGELSGGERQKVFIARAMAAKPEILILDEPTTGVDSASQEEFYTLLRTLNTDGITILFVSHDIEVMAKEASTILCLNKTLVADCAAHDFMHTPQASELYGTAVGHIHHHHHQS